MVDPIIAGVNLIIRAINAVSPFKDIPYIPKMGQPTPKGLGQGFREFEQSTNLAPRAVAPSIPRRAEGGTTIQVNVNGADPNAVVQTLRKYVRQTGSLPVRTAAIG